MRFFSLFLLIVMFSVFMNCSTLTVRSDYDREYDFTKYKTYRWPSDSEIDRNDILAKNPLVYGRVQKSVNKELKAKGFTLQDSVETDFVVIAHAGIKERMQIHQYGGQYGWYHTWWGPYGGYTDVSYYEEGTLVIDIVDFKNKELAWRGSGTGVVKDFKDNNKMQNDLDVVVGKILVNFPPTNN